MTNNGITRDIWIVIQELGHNRKNWDTIENFSSFFFQACPMMIDIQLSESSSIEFSQEIYKIKNGDSDEKLLLEYF